MLIGFKSQPLETILRFIQSFIQSFIHYPDIITCAVNASFMLSGRVGSDQSNLPVSNVAVDASTLGTVCRACVSVLNFFYWSVFVFVLKYFYIEFH